MVRSSLRTIARDFKEMDKNHRGKVDKDEYAAFVQRQFDAAIPDNDQSLDRKELTSPRGRRFMVLLGALGGSTTRLTSAADRSTSDNMGDIDRAAGSGCSSRDGVAAGRHDFWAGRYCHHPSRRYGAAP